MDNLPSVVLMGDVNESEVCAVSLTQAARICDASEFLVPHFYFSRLIIAINSKYYSLLKAQWTEQTKAIKSNRK